MQNNEKICWKKIKRSSRLAKCGNNKCKRGWKMGNSLFKKNHTQMKMFYEDTTVYVQILLSFMYFKDTEYFKINLLLREEQCMIPPLHISA